MKQIISAVVLLLGFSGILSAASDLEIHDQQGVRYVTGGMTKEEVDELNRMAPRFQVHIVMIDHKMQHQPIKGVDVTMRDVSGNVVLQAKSEGPLMFVDVIGGRYTVEAVYNGQTLSETKDMTGRRYLRLRFTFNE